MEDSCNPHSIELDGICHDQESTNKEEANEMCLEEPFGSVDIAVKWSGACDKRCDRCTDKVVDDNSWQILHVEFLIESEYYSEDNIEDDGQYDVKHPSWL